MKTLKKLLTLSMVLSILFISSCGDDDELDPTSQQLIGVWETEDQLRFQVSVEGLTQEELVEYEEVINLLLQAYAQGFFGTVEFKSDLTYTASFGGTAETGTWQVVDEGSAIILTETGETEETELEIVSLTSSTLVVSFQEVEMNDINGDGSDDTFTINIELTLNKI